MATTTVDVAALSQAFMGKTNQPVNDTILDTQFVPVKQTASKAVYTGVLSFGLVNIAIKTYKANDQAAIALKNVNADTLQPIKMAKTDSVTGEKLAPSATTKAYEFNKKFYALNEDEITACEPQTDGAMNIANFVPAASVDPIYFEKSYYVAPEAGAERPFALLLAGMKATKKVAVAQFSSRGRQTTAILRPIKLDTGTEGIAMHYMYYDNEVRDFNGWNNVPNQLDPAEVELASQLVNVYAADFDVKQYRDSYMDRLSGVIASKVKGLAAPILKKAAPVVAAGNDLMATLKASLAAASKDKGAVKA